MHGVDLNQVLMILSTRASGNVTDSHPNLTKPGDWGYKSPSPHKNIIIALYKSLDLEFLSTKQAK